MSDSKVCSKCKVEKNINYFIKKSASKDGFGFWCKECLSIYAKKYYLINLDHVKEVQINYRLNNKDKTRLRNKKWQQNNRCKVNEFNKKYYEKNKDKLLKKAHFYRKTHRIRLNEYQKKARDMNIEECRRKERIYSKKFSNCLSDYYVSGLLRNLKIGYFAGYKPPPELIKAKRAQIQLLRTIKEKYK